LDVRTALARYLATPCRTFRSAWLGASCLGAAYAALVNGARTLRRSTGEASLRINSLRANSLRANSLRKCKACAAHQDSGG
jgi:hypothetical protein